VPAFRSVVPAQELADLGQHFADLERQQFGRDEFGAMVARVARIEQHLGIYDLGQFTPQVGPFLPGTLTARPAGRVAGLSRADGFACRRQNVVMAQYGRAGSKG
jgi:hypothetical protein